MIEDTTENEETITNCKNQIQITNSKGTFSVSAEDFAEKYVLFLMRGMDKSGTFSREVIEKSGKLYKKDLLDFLQGYIRG